MALYFLAQFGKIVMVLNVYFWHKQQQQQQQQINFINNYQLKEEHAQLAYSIS